MSIYRVTLTEDEMFIVNNALTTQCDVNRDMVFNGADELFSKEDLYISAYRLKEMLEDISVRIDQMIAHERLRIKFEVK